MLYSVGCETCEASMDKQEKKETNWFSAQTERTNFNWLLIREKTGIIQLWIQGPLSLSLSLSIYLKTISFSAFQYATKLSEK